MEYVVLLQPAILVATVVATVFQLTRMVSRVEVEDEELGTRKAFRVTDSGMRLRRAAAVGLSGFLLGAAIVVTPPGHRGVIYSQSGGVQDRERVEGLSFILPVFQSAIQMDVRELKWATACAGSGSQRVCVNEVFAQSKDLQEINVHIAVNYAVKPEVAAELYREVGRGYADVIIRPAVLQLAKAEIGEILAEAFATEREQLAIDIQAGLQDRLGRWFTVTFVSIEDAIFDPAFITAVKNKVIADEKADEQARLVAAAESEADQVEKRAEGVAAAIRVEADAQAHANRVIAQSLSPDLLVWQRLVSWNGTLPETFLGSSDGLDAIIDLK